METPRDRRLRSEYNRMKKLAEDPNFIILPTQGDHPIEYRVILQCRGIEAVQDGNVVYRNEHHVLIRLTPEFPLDAPEVMWLTPLYHPNIFPPLTCLGDHWYPGWSIAEMCRALHDMAQYKTFNIYDPLNKEAARWVEQRLDSGEGEIITREERAGSDDPNFEINPVQRTS